MQDTNSANLQILGRHVIAEYYGCNAQHLDDIAKLSQLLVTAARRAGATPLKQEFHQFAPHGISGVIIIMESHLTIHTWPELKYAAVDFFTCGETTDPLRAHEYLSQELGATTSHQLMLHRGLERQPIGAGNLWRTRLVAGAELRAIRSIPAAGDTAGLWLSDEQEDQVSALRVRKVLHAGRTAYAQAEIVDTDTFGRLLSLDGQIQSAAADEAIYHESLVVPPFVLAEIPLRKVAILGGGEGATLREVLRFPEVERCVMVDIDPELVALCRTHLPGWSSGAFDDPRAALHFEDARQFLERAASQGDKYDLIICDLPDAELGSPLAELYSQPFFELLRRCLSASGIYAGHIGSLQMAPSVLGPPDILSVAAKVFAQIRPYSRFIPSFGAEWTFAVAGHEKGIAQLTPAEVDSRLAQRRHPAWPCRTYDGTSHQRLFSLPKDMRAALFREKGDK